MRSLVTGGGGFLGRAIVEQLLASGDQVTVVGRSHYPDLVRPGVAQVRCDLRDREACAAAFVGVDRVFHVAALVGVWGRWRDYYDNNVRGTQNVIDACRRNSISRLIFTSTPSVVFDGKDHAGVDESYPYAKRWLSPYPRSKKIAEVLVLAANGSDGLATVALRPHLIWGKGDPSLIPRVIAKAKAGKLVRVGRGTNKVDIIHVRDAARAHLLAAECLGPTSANAGKAYFLSQGEPVLLWDFIDDILRRNGISPVKRAMPLRAAYAIGASLEMGYRLVGARREPQMTRFIAHQLARSHYYDIAAAQRDFGYLPMVSTAHGLDEMFA